MRKTLLLLTILFSVFAYAQVQQFATDLFNKQIMSSVEQQNKQQEMNEMLADYILQNNANKNIKNRMFINGLY